MGWPFASASLLGRRGGQTCEPLEPFRRSRVLFARGASAMRVSLIRKQWTVLSCLGTPESSVIAQAAESETRIVRATAYAPRTGRAVYAGLRGIHAAVSEACSNQR